MTSHDIKTGISLIKDSDRIWEIVHDPRTITLIGVDFTLQYTTYDHIWQWLNEINEGDIHYVYNSELASLGVFNKLLMTYLLIEDEEKRMLFKLKYPDIIANNA
jgi:hypothetical protein